MGDINSFADVWLEVYSRCIAAGMTREASIQKASEGVEDFKSGFIAVYDRRNQ